MAVTRGEFNELVTDLMGAGDPSTEDKFHPGIIWKVAEFVRNALIEEAFDRNAKHNHFDLNGDFVSSFANVSISLDADRDERFSELPTPVISLKDNLGIRQVSAMKGQRNSFSLVPNGAISTRSLLETFAFKSAKYYVEADRIYYIDVDKDVDKVLIKMVSSITNLPEDQPIPIPANLENVMLERVVAILKEPKTTKQDKENDSNPNG